jgi:hypothetical protein
MGTVCSTYGKKNVYRALVGKPQGNRLLGKRRRRWKDITSSSWRNYFLDMTRFTKKMK